MTTHQFILACLLVAPALGAVMDACNVDSDCSPSSTKCVKLATNCDKMGYCMCKDDYMQMDTMCKMKKDFNASCDGAMDYCEGASTCQAVTGQTDMSTCRCANGVSYNDKLKMCTNQKAVTEACNANSDCYNSGSGVECNGQSMCACSTGYMQGSGDYMYMCMMPKLDEACTGSSMCMQELPSELSDNSIGTPMCMSSMCKCPDGYTKKSIVVLGMTYKVCQMGSADKEAGDSCSLHGDCEGGVCAMCPGVTGNQRICITLETNGGATIGGHLYYFLAAAIFAVLY